MLTVAEFFLILKIARGDGMTYTLGYDSFHNLSSIGIEGKSESLASYLYTTGGRPKSVTYANGDSVRFVYNASQYKPKSNPF